MTHYGLIGTLQAQPGQGDALAAILIEASALMTAAPTCHSYVVCRKLDDADALVIYERWSSKADHDASLDDPKVRALITTAVPLLAAPPQQGMELDVLGGE